MTVHSFHRILHRIGAVASRFPGARGRNLRQVRAEIARYPTNVQADLGWPPVIDDRLPVIHIIKSDGMN